MSEQRSTQTFESYIRNYPNVEGFFDVLERFRIQKGVKPVTLYRKAGITKSYYYKLRTTKYPNIAKERVIAFGLALRLTRQEMDELLLVAGFALSRYSKFDLAVMFCLEQRIYDIDEIQNLVPKQYQNSVYVRRTGNGEEPEEDDEDDDADKMANLVDILNELADRLEEFAMADIPFPWENGETEDEEAGEEAEVDVLAVPIVKALEDLADMFNEATDKIIRNI